MSSSNFAFRFVSIGSAINLETKFEGACGKCLCRLSHINSPTLYLFFMESGPVEHFDELGHISVIYFGLRF